MNRVATLRFRDAVPTDQAMLDTWMQAPHVLANVPYGDWGWAQELARKPLWRHQWIALLGDRPIGFMQIIDAAAEETHYWGDIAPRTAAIDIWIGEADCVGHGLGSEMMARAIDFSFGWRTINRVVIDPLASNTDGRRFYERLGFQLLELRSFGDDDCAVYELHADAWQARRPA